jgi:hypothetical protein
VSESEYARIFVAGLRKTTRTFVTAANLKAKVSNLDLPNTKPASQFEVLRQCSKSAHNINNAV